VGDGRAILKQISERKNPDVYRHEHWEGSFTDYLDTVRQHPGVTRNAFQRMYDLVISHGSYPIEGSKENLVRYSFFDDPENDGRDAIFGLTKPLMELVNVFKSAALGYGSERRVLLLHGPVGSSKSTIARLLKRGLERYSQTDAGALYSYGWKEPSGTITWCPMREEPLHLVPADDRPHVVEFLNEGHSGDHETPKVEISGDLCPLCRFMYNERLKVADGNWTKVMADIVVHRVFLAEADRAGIGTFQPKDEKNQDSTELTGDINYRKIAEFGSESDPRAFNFDGEFNIANRGLIEFIEVLKLDVAFLYDLLGASQEHKIKPRSFRRPISTPSSSGIPTSPSTASCNRTSSWRPSATAR
jgi:serine protein kinase